MCPYLKEKFLLLLQGANERGVCDLLKQKATSLFMLGRGLFLVTSLMIQSMYAHF
jgi:hypothetical protein